MHYELIKSINNPSWLIQIQGWCSSWTSVRSLGPELSPGKLSRSSETQLDFIGFQWNTLGKASQHVEGLNWQIIQMPCKHNLNDHNGKANSALCCLT